MKVPGRAKTAPPFDGALAVGQGYAIDREQRIANPDFQEGRMYTGFVEEFMASDWLTQKDAHAEELERTAAYLGALVVDQKRLAGGALVGHSPSANGTTSVRDGSKWRVAGRREAMR